MGRRNMFNEVIVAFYIFVFICIICYCFYVFYDTPYYVVPATRPVIIKKNPLIIEPRLLSELHKHCFGFDFRFGIDAKGAMLHKSYLYFFGRKPFYEYGGSGLDMPIFHIMASRPGFFPHGYSYVITKHLQFSSIRYFYDKPIPMRLDPGYYDVELLSLCAFYCIYMLYFWLLGCGIRIQYVAVVMLPCVYIFAKSVWY